MKRCTLHIASLILALILAAPAYGEDVAPESREAPGRDPVGAVIEGKLTRAGSTGGENLSRRGEALRFYEARGFAPAFSGSKDAKKDEAGLIEGIEGAHSHGLEPADYHLEAIEALRRGLDGADGARRDELLAGLDVLMADAFFELASHLECGKANPYFSNANQRSPGCDVDFVAVLQEALERHDIKGTLEGLAPKTEGYSRLMKALAKMRETAAKESWPSVSDSGRDKIEPGDTDRRVIEVRRRLEAQGFIEPPAQSKAKTRAEINEEMQATSARPGEDFYDDALVEAVKRFQAEYGLKEDGVIGKRTVLMMNRDPAWRVCQIKINLDRLRALDRVIVTDRYALVNIPDFKLTIFEGGKPIKEMNVIVGMLDRKSPLMSDNIRFLVFSPKWHVPTSIAVKDKLPKIKKDPSFIRKQGMKVYAVGETGIEEVEPEAVDWESVDATNFSYRIVQATGDANALGRVKFMFPNRHAVYLHDTPTKYLFDRGQRTYSSGCIRIADPIWFAEYLLTDKDGWDRERITAAMRRATPLDVPINEHMPIHILYITAWADEEGNPVFRHDVYGYDKVLSKQFCK